MHGHNILDCEQARKANMNQLRGHPTRANVRKMYDYGWDLELDITIPTEKWHVCILDHGCKTHPPSTSVTRKPFDMAPFFGWEKCWMNLEHPRENFGQKLCPLESPPLVYMDVVNLISGIMGEQEYNTSAYFRQRKYMSLCVAVCQYR